MVFAASDRAGPDPAWRVAGHGSRSLGHQPASLLQQFAEASEDEDEKTGLRRAVGAVGRLGSDIVKGTWTNIAGGAGRAARRRCATRASKGIRKRRVSFWDRCALPVLAAVADAPDPTVAAGFISLGRGRGVRTLGVDLEDQQIVQALLALGDAGYVSWNSLTYETGPGASFAGLRVTGRGQQALGHGRSSTS